VVNEITIVVQARNATKAVFDAVRADARTLGVDIGTKINNDTTQTIKREAESGGGAYSKAGDAIGKNLGQHISQQITEKINISVRDSVNESVRIVDSNGRLRDSRGRFVSASGSNNGRERVDVDVHDHVDVDVNKQSFLSRISSMGDEAAKDIDGKLTSAVSSVFSGDVISTALKGLAIGGLVAALAPVLGAAVTTVVLGALGGGAIGAGIMAQFKQARVKDPLTGAMVTKTVFKDPQLEADMQEFHKKSSALFSDFGSNFSKPFGNFIRAIPGLFNQFEPMIKHIGVVFGPVTDTLQRGIVGFLQNAMPGILRATEKAAPLFDMLGSRLPSLGDAVGKLFDDIGNGGPQAAAFFGDLLTAVGLVIRAIGRLIEVLTKMYGVIRTVAVGAVNVFGDILQAAIYAFSWIPGLSPKLAAASDKFEVFRKKVNHSLDAIPNEKTITIRIRQIGANIGFLAMQVAEIAAGRASGGIIGGAASGGTRSGLTWVGENGPELIDAPAGTRVHSAGDSARIAAGAGQGGMGAVVVQLVLDGKVIATAMADPMRKYVGGRFGGNVQAAYGR
jgi:hypothetical protein